MFDRADDFDSRREFARVPIIHFPGNKYDQSPTRLNSAYVFPGNRYDEALRIRVIGSRVRSWSARAITVDRMLRYPVTRLTRTDMPRR